MSLFQDSITFGKYKGYTLARILRDRNYCKWLLEQDWFKTNYAYLYNRVNEYNPKVYFLNPEKGDTEDFIDSYVYFNLTPIEELKIELDSTDSACYKYYLYMIDQIKNCIYNLLENDADNPYDIKAPTKWLQKFEKDFGIPRVDFKNFLAAYELQNIPYIIERIKKEGGLEYKGAKSYKIAKARSEAQEQWWEQILKDKYGENLGTQFSYDSCIFDFINIKTKTIFECKLGLKDFDENQLVKYKAALKEYRVIYLIARDCVIDMDKKIIYTLNPDKYEIYIIKISMMKNVSYLDEIIQHFTIVKIENIETLFGT